MSINAGCHYIRVPVYIGLFVLTFYFEANACAQPLQFVLLGTHFYTITSNFFSVPGQRGGKIDQNRTTLLQSMCVAWLKKEVKLLKVPRTYLVTRITVTSALSIKSPGTRTSHSPKFIFKKKTPEGLSSLVHHRDTFLESLGMTETESSPMPHKRQSIRYSW